MFIKKLYNDLDTLVDEAMAGSRLIADDAEKYSRVLPNSRITVRRDKYKKPMDWSSWSAAEEQAMRALREHSSVRADLTE